MPFVVQPLQQAFEAIGEATLEAAATLRAGPWDRFFSVAVPLARPGFLTAAVLGFAHTVGEFGVVLMIGGNIPGQTRVVSVQIYDHVEALEYAPAHALAAAMLRLQLRGAAGCCTRVDTRAQAHDARAQPGTASRRASRSRIPGFRLDVELQLPGRGFTALFGASGSGKTSCLRAIAGLLHAPGGCSVRGEVWQDDARASSCRRTGVRSAWCSSTRRCSRT